MRIETILTLRLSTTGVGNRLEVWWDPDTFTAHSSKDPKFSTLAEVASKWLLFPATIKYLTIYFSGYMYFEEWTIGEDEIEKTQYEEKIWGYAGYPESFWVDSDFCT